MKKKLEKQHLCKSLATLSVYPLWISRISDLNLEDRTWLRETVTMFRTNQTAQVWQQDVFL